MNSGIDEVVDDFNDGIYDNLEGEKFVIKRPEMQSLFFIKLVNKFGTENGFGMILQRIQDKENPVSFIKLRYFVQIVGQLYQMYYRKFALEYIPAFVAAVIEYLENAEGAVVKTFNKSNMDSISTCLGKLVERYMLEEEKNEFIEKFNLQMAWKIFQAESLQQRIDGLKMIVDMIRSIKFKRYKFLTKDFIKQWIKENKVFEVLYSHDSHV